MAHGLRGLGCGVSGVQCSRSQVQGVSGCTLKGSGQALTPMTPRAERLKMVVVISRTRLHSSNIKVLRIRVEIRAVVVPVITAVRASMLGRLRTNPHVPCG